MAHASHSNGVRHTTSTARPYLLLAAMLLLSFVSMYVLMYAMVDGLADVYPNRNQTYMAALMTAPMALFELALMRAMYPLARTNAIIAVLALGLLAASFLMIRAQTAIDDRQFLRSMIPHHSGAILMCREADLADAEVKRLCTEIIEAQRREIDQMRAILRRM